MQTNDAVIRTYVKRGRISSPGPATGQVNVSWEDGSVTVESLRDLDYGDPQPLDKLMAHANYRAKA